MGDWWYSHLSNAFFQLRISVDSTKDFNNNIYDNYAVFEDTFPFEIKRRELFSDRRARGLNRIISFSKASHFSLLCALPFSRAEQSLACSCQGWSWGCLREAGEELKEQWLSGVVYEGKSKWLRKKWESVNGNKHKSARKNNKLSKDAFLIVNAGISTSFTAISHEW